MVNWSYSTTHHKISGFELTYRDIFLMPGGLFLIYKSTIEIHHKLEVEEIDVKSKSKANSFSSVIFQIILLDAVFSFDSILTAVVLVDKM
ncbi:hypothetical protein QYS49_34965 [Marivirga salinae]|uniref:Uncharacterized protein n=1 Tax=Marivirga salinarum TaxID=3059078 RepID=A0AA51NCJ6_9BACT|nr:hypothetical protein [Marivirga sp. BDSF4-3]WMN12906.1 hypothetical protein QYS49_34965 [Marivirga sp. BDSF4-3]